MTERPSLSPLVDVDPDGVIQLTITSIVHVAAQSLERGSDPREALLEVLRIARRIEVLWLNEQITEAHR